MSGINKAALLTIFIVCAAVAYLLLARSPDIDIKGVRYFTPAVELQSFRLQDHSERQFDNQRIAGQWSVLFFGYTHCPDICPTVLLDMANIYSEYTKQQSARQLQVAFVSVDPNRDSLSLLKNYVAYFNKDFIGVTGERQQINALANGVGAMYDFEDAVSGERLTAEQLVGKQGYKVNHYAALILLNPQGEMVAHIYPPHEPKRVVKALNTIINS